MKEYSLSDTSDSATAIIAYTIRAMNNCGFSKMQVDRYIKMIKNLSYNELVDLSNSILSSCNDYIRDLYNKVKNRLSRKYASVKLIDGCTDTYTEWVIAMNGPGEYVSYSLTPGKDEDYEPIDGIDVTVRGDDGSEEWSGSKRHFNNADEVINFILRG